MAGRKCFVPSCTNDSNNSPDKIFVSIREDLREKWCRKVNAEYFKVHRQYCCEDHLDVKAGLKNYYKHKLMKEEPILKPTAILRVINLPKNLQKEHSRTTTQQSIETSELEKLLMQSQTAPSIYTAPNQRKLEEMPSATLCCTLPRKVHVAIQCVTQT